MLTCSYKNSWECWWKGGRCLYESPLSSFKVFSAVAARVGFTSFSLSLLLLPLLWHRGGFSSPVFPSLGLSHHLSLALTDSPPLRVQTSATEDALSLKLDGVDFCLGQTEFGGT